MKQWKNEIRFNGTVDDLCGIVDDLNSRVERIVYRANKTDTRNANIQFVPPGFYRAGTVRGGEIVASPADKNSLWLRVLPDKGLEIGLWDTLHDRLKRDGWLDEQPAETSAGNGQQGNDLDSLILLIQNRGLGHRPESDLEMAAAWLAWNRTPKAEKKKLDTWLSDKFGADAQGAPNVLTDSFHNYKRKVPPEYLARLKEN